MKSKVLASFYIGSMAMISSYPAQAWSPGNAEEQRYFNQYVREQLVYIPPTPVYDSLGNFSHYEGPTYEQQFQWEYDRQIAAGRNAANTRSDTINNSSREVQRLQNSLANDQRISDLRVKRQNAQSRVDQASRMTPDGPAQSEVTRRLSDSRTAGGQLDSDRDGKISESEMKAALAGRVSMQRTQYLNEKKLDIDGNNEIGKTETGAGLKDVTGRNALDHDNLLDQRKAKPNYNETGIGQGTYVDAYGNVKNKKSLNNQTALKAELAKYTAERNVAANSRDNDRMTARKLRNGDLPTTTHRHASITTTGTWGTTRNYDRSWDAGSGINSGVSQIQNQMGNAQAHGRNNSFYNRAQASTSGLRGANTQASANLANAQRTQNQTSGFRNAQAEVNRTLNSIR